MNARYVDRQRESLLATWRSPLSFTALVPIVRGTEQELRDLLAKLRPTIEAALPAVDDLHSFRLVVVPASAPGVQQLQLLLNLVHDHPLDEHLTALIACAGPSLTQVFASAGGSGDPQELPALWQQHRVRENTLHLGAIRRALADIRLEEALREEIGLLADHALAEGRWQADTPAETIRLELQRRVLAEASRRNLPAGPAPVLSSLGRALQFKDLLKTFLFPAIGVLSTDISNAIRRISDRGRRRRTRIAYSLWWIYGGIPTGLAFLGVRFLELIEPDVELPPAAAAKVERLEDAEDVRLKNEVTYWFAVRDSWMRRLLLRIVLWGSERGCRHFWTDGKLAGIDTIHYARILQLAGKRVMLFMSDYDGSLDRYLLDFMGVGSRAVIPIASNVAGCPKTRWLFGQDNPTTFGPRLRNLLRTYQLEIAVWYNAYPHLDVRDVLINGSIRDGLFAPTMSEEDAQRWAEML